MIDIARHKCVDPSTIASAPPAGVDLWLLDLADYSSTSHSTFAHLVSDEELTRAQHFKNNSAHFLATRALLRRVLAHYTSLSTQDLRFARGHHGKPFLTNAPSPLYFNLSHSNDLAVLAVTGQGEVGVDIESFSERDYLKIAKRYFHPRELQALHDCSAAEREFLFYKLWTLKEAFFKATGGGIATGLDKISFQFDQQKINAELNPMLDQQIHNWQFHQELITSDTLVALVLDSPTPIQHQWLKGNSLLMGV